MMTRLAPPRDLTIPEPGSETARAVLSAAVAKTMGQLCQLRPNMALSHWGRARVVEIRRICQRLKDHQVGALASLARDPSISVWVRCLRRPAAFIGGPGQALSGDQLVARLLASIGYNLALTGGLRAPVVVEGAVERLVSLNLRRAADISPGAEALRFEPGRVFERVEGKWRGLEALGDLGHKYFPAVDDDTVLALRDDNPLRLEEAHPDKEGNALDLGERSADEWLRALRGGLDLVDEFMPDVRREMRLLMRQVVPVGYDAERHLSASYQESIGTVYMTLHPLLMTMTEALIHEFSHNKLNALFDVDPVIENPPDALYTSPVRPDPRPLLGVLLAVHAFLPVARLYELMIEGGHPLAKSPVFLERFEAIKEKNHQGAELVLEHGIATPVGRGLMDEIRRWDEHFS